MTSRFFTSISKFKSRSSMTILSSCQVKERLSLNYMIIRRKFSSSSPFIKRQQKAYYSESDPELNPPDLINSTDFILNDYDQTVSKQSQSLRRLQYKSKNSSLKYKSSTSDTGGEQQLNSSSESDPDHSTKKSKSFRSLPRIHIDYMKRNLFSRKAAVQSDSDFQLKWQFAEERGLRLLPQCSTIEIVEMLEIFSDCYSFRSNRNNQQGSQSQSDSLDSDLNFRQFFFSAMSILQADGQFESLRYSHFASLLTSYRRMNMKNEKLLILIEKRLEKDGVDVMDIDSLSTSVTGSDSESDSECSDGSESSSSDTSLGEIMMDYSEWLASDN